MTRLDLAGASVLWTDASVGNLGHWPPRKEHDDICCGAASIERRRSVLYGAAGPSVTRDWFYVTQVHGSGVVTVGACTTGNGEPGDALVTSDPGIAVAVATADCAPVALASPSGVVAAVHAGWRGLAAGVIATAATRMREMGAGEIVAALGPCIHSECYEFDSNVLAQLSESLGCDVAATTKSNTPSLDMVAAVEAACSQSAIQLEFVHDDCTACDPKYFSHRARSDDGRQIMLVWRAP